MRVTPVSTAPLLALAAALFIAVADNRVFWGELARVIPPDDPSRIALHAAVLALLVTGLTAILLLVALPYVMKPVLIALLLASALCQHFMVAYGVVIDRELVQSALETDLAEVCDLVGRGLLVQLVLLGLVPSALVAGVPLRFAPLRRALLERALLLSSCLAVMLGVSLAACKPLLLQGRQHPELRRLINPVGPAQALARYLLPRRDRDAPGAPVQVALDAHRAALLPRRERPLLMVLVVGETARAANFSLNGYGRETNPRLAALPVISFPNVRSCGTSTSVSVPCMFSARGSRAAGERSTEREDGLLDVLQRVGIRVLWRDNNSGCKHACDHVPSELRRELWKPGLCRSGSCLDAVLLEDLQQRIDALDGDALIVLHQLGSHGPAYHRRSPAALKRYAPECDRADLESCSRESIVNAYDNSILYTDLMLARVIEVLAANADRRDTAMLYVSDHGESLGENGVYLHGLPWLLAPDEQTHVPMILWLSDGIRSELRIDSGCLSRGADAPVSHDVLFHSLLGLFDVETGAYRSELDVFSACRPARTGRALARSPG